MSEACETLGFSASTDGVIGGGEEVAAFLSKACSGINVGIQDLAARLWTRLARSDRQRRWVPPELLLELHSELENLQPDGI